MAQLQRDRKELLEGFMALMPEAVEALTGEERNRVYNLLRLRVTVGVGGTVEVQGIIGEGFCISEGKP